MTHDEWLESDPNPYNKGREIDGTDDNDEAYEISKHKEVDNRIILNHFGELMHAQTRAIIAMRKQICGEGE